MIKAITDTHILKIGFILMTFLFFSCNNEELGTSTTDVVTAQLKKDLKLDQFTNKNIAENVIVNWKNIKKIDKDGFEIYEVEINEKIKTKLESNLFQKQLNYELIAIKSKNETRSYLVEVYSSLKHSSNYPSSLNELKNFTGTLNVFELSGIPINQVVIIDGKAINPSNNNSIVPLIMGINSFYHPTNLTSRLPNCTEVRYIKVEEEMYIDHYDVWKMAATGNVVAINFKNSEYVGTRIYYSNVPYDCDQAGDPVHQIQRMPSYRNFAFEDHIDDSTLDPCPKEVMQQLKIGTSCKIVDVLNKLNADYSKYNVIIKSVMPQDGTPAATIRGSQFNYTIQISKDYTGATKLFRASNLLHELVHAYFMSLKDDYSGTPPNLSAFNDYPALFQAFCNKKYPLSNADAANVHHLEMANQYVDAIGAALQEYQTGIAVANGVKPDQVFTDLAWGGLMKAPIFAMTFPIGSVDYNRIINRYGCEQVGRSVGNQTPVGKPCN